MVGTQKGYNGVATTYFASMLQQEHYIFKLGYVIAQVDGKAKVGKLETLMEILMFHQGSWEGNMFALGSLIFVMLATKKELVSTLVGFALTIIGYYY
jgi:hypothetical protein